MIVSHKIIVPTILIPLSVVLILLIITSMPGEPCMEFSGWHWETIWPKSRSCQ